MTGRIQLRALNFVGDGQADLKHHGGPDKAVCVYPTSHYPNWQDELGIKLAGGGFGENLTVAELTEASVCIGDVWQIRDARVQVSQPRQPCWKLSRWWDIEDLAVRVQQTSRTGWYLRVLEEGDVEAGAEVFLIDRPNPDWTIAAPNELMHHDKNNIATAQALATLPELSASWRATLTRRCQKRTEPNAKRRLFGDVR
ncbi:MAG: MOSC domain-containing protein [Planctomycetaceae bacterium]